MPSRLCDKPYELIEAANDWHYAMMNDHPRNVFYKEALRHIINPESVVLEIGAGSGLLSIIAASLGARTVVAIEANRHLANVAREIIRRNGYSDRVHIINKMSTEVPPPRAPHPVPAPSRTPRVCANHRHATRCQGTASARFSGPTGAA